MLVNSWMCSLLTGMWKIYCRTSVFWSHITVRKEQAYCHRRRSGRYATSTRRVFWYTIIFRTFYICHFCYKSLQNTCIRRHITFWNKKSRGWKSPKACSERWSRRGNLRINLHLSAIKTQKKIQVLCGEKYLSVSGRSNRCKWEEV